MNLKYTPLSNRGILCITGPDRCSFLQGLVTQDVQKATSDTTIYSALLTPQGKFLFDFFLLYTKDALYLECEQDRLEDLQSHLTKFKLRADVTLTNITEQWQVVSVFGTKAHEHFNLEAQAGRTAPFEEGFAFADPRLVDLGVRLILPLTATLPKPLTENANEVTFDAYDQHRLSLGIPDGSRDMIPEKAIPLECNLDALNAIDWDKGCYMGQELTSRTKHRGLVRKRLLPVTLSENTLPFLTPLLLDDKKVGSMRTSAAGVGLALVRLEVMEICESPRLQTAENVEVVPRIPEFLRSVL